MGYWIETAPKQFGYDIFILAVVGLVLAIIIPLVIVTFAKKRIFPSLICSFLCLSFLIPYWIVLSLSKVGFGSYLLPTGPILGIFFGFLYGGRSLMKKSPIKSISNDE